MVETLVTEAEYLAREEGAETKSEFEFGRIVAMSGGTHPHALLSTKATAILFRSEHDGCNAYNSDMLVGTPDGRRYYPDASFACDPIVEKRRILLNPIVVVEVLSPSTENRDRTVKLDGYLSIPSLKAYVLLDSRGVLARLFSRTAAGWILTEHAGRDAVVPLEAIGGEFRLSELYRNLSDDDLRA